jgi:hypothetical protein
MPASDANKRSSLPKYRGHGPLLRNYGIYFYDSKVKKIQVIVDTGLIN